MQDHHEALMEVLRRTPETPHWVQLPLNTSEGFLIQFCEGMPGLRSDPTVSIENNSARFETGLVKFYRDYLAATKGEISLDKTRFTVSRNAAPGLYLMLEALEGWDPWVIKGQITGPITILMGIHNGEGHSAYCDKPIRDTLVKLLAQKARWQAELLKSVGSRAIVFVNEHVSSQDYEFPNFCISKKRDIACLKRVLRAIQEAGIWSGVHICGEADWRAILQCNLNALGFDSYSYFDQIEPFRSEIAAFLEKGGMLAWGIVPIKPNALRESNASDLAKLWISQAQRLEIPALSLTDIFLRSFITPGCGLDKIDKKLAIRAMDLTIMVSNILRVIFFNQSE